MKLADYSTLAEAQAASTVSNKLLSSAKMRALLVELGLYEYFINSTNVFYVATIDNIRSADDFNFIDGHPDNIGTLMDVMISEATALDPMVMVTPIGQSPISLPTALTQLKARGVAHCNIDTYPYADVTQAEFDEAVALNALQTPSQANAVGYPVFDTASPWYVQGSNTRTQVAIVCDENLPADAVFTVTAHPDTTGNKEFADIGFKVRDIKMPAGAKSTVVRMADKFPQYTQFKVECSLNVVFTASFKAV